MRNLSERQASDKVPSKILCRICKKEVGGVSFCPACGANFCENCWSTQIAHDPDSTAEPRHEKSDRQITERLQGILTPATDQDAQRQLHLDDSLTTWLKWTKGFRDPELQEYDRYKKLMQTSFSSQWKERWPQFVSFIGQTGDGKSTIIKMLIESQGPANKTSNDNFPTPVVGGSGISTPTSADIHLYIEPESELTRFPRIYADCEGLEGGEKMPVAHGWIEETLSKKRNEMRLDETSARKMRDKAQRGIKRKLKWAITDEKRKREYTVRELYPRLLYTFSNVVVFVLANERTFESHAFVRLLDWAATSVQSSTNQSVLPHVIVVLNKSDDRLKEIDFDVDETTQKLLSDADQSLTANTSIYRHVRYWRSQGRDIRTARDLLACFYCSVNVVRIPQRGRWMLMDRQIKRLHNLIASNCRGSHEGKLQARRDLNAEELGECLKSGLDHFTSDLDRPFDFLGFSWGLNPIAPGLEGNILRLALWVKDCAPNPRPEAIFEYLSSMVASCIMLDFVRYRKREGTPLELFEHYKPFLDGALYTFCNVWWPCNYKNSRGKKCINTRDGHARGHQDENGRPIGPGEYKSSFSADIYRLKWHGRLEHMLQEIHNSMIRRNLTDVLHSQHSEAREAADLHLARMESFYSGLGGAQSGGIRGIVELVVLREIEHELGQNFRIQDFFDLIVGTR
ncbi:MAG: hypothetical protein L6R41_005594 [Letrouitia leprolyta]|nr:MAG: hypothetical protein L6R41_005594 [Letrouitia leprolyta]